VRHLAKSKVDSPQIPLPLVGVICGLIGGGLLRFFVAVVIEIIYRSVELVLPGPHSAKGMLAFYICLYSAWLLIIWLFARRVELTFWALVTFPMPTMLFATWLLE
jgi:hypothetical protein